MTDKPTAREMTADEVAAMRADALEHPEDHPTIRGVTFPTPAAYKRVLGNEA